MEIGCKYLNKFEKSLTLNMLSPSTQLLFVVEAIALNVNVPWIIFWYIYIVSCQNNESKWQIAQFFQSF